MPESVKGFKKISKIFEISHTTANMFKPGCARKFSSKGDHKVLKVKKKNLEFSLQVALATVDVKVRASTF